MANKCTSSDDTDSYDDLLLCAGSAGTKSEPIRPSCAQRVPVLLLMPLLFQELLHTEDKSHKSRCPTRDRPTLPPSQVRCASSDLAVSLSKETNDLTDLHL